MIGRPLAVILLILLSLARGQEKIGKVGGFINSDGSAIFTSSQIEDTSRPLLAYVGDGSEDNTRVSETMEIKVDRGSLVILSMDCTQENGSYATVFLRTTHSYEIVRSLSVKCSKGIIMGEAGDNSSWNVIRFFSDPTRDVTYNVIMSGSARTQFDVNYSTASVDLPLNESVPMTVKGVTIRTFDITETYRYVAVQVESNTLEIVGKLIVTQDTEELYQFLVSPNASTTKSMRLSFSSFGSIALSDVSQPALAQGTWMVAVVLFTEGGAEKDVTFNIMPVKEYEYVSKIFIILVVSCFGVVLPIFCRYIFNYMNADRQFTLQDWLQVVVNWFYRGNKGLAYLTGFLAWMLLVSAFQVVNAKWREMKDNGDRDVCYYNEKCYRPYIGYYDVSVNGIASNLCFMVHGAILIISVSFYEANCYSLKHKNYDYSIPYSFGMAFIFEGFGSLLYHICPSQIIFQFDTLFMFVISQYVITALVDGNAVRKTTYKDGSNVVDITRPIKSIRSPKLFLFFLGPAYGFNFLGNLDSTEPLPEKIAFVFYMFLGLWVLSILLWAAYKANLLPDTYFRPAVIQFTDTGVKVVTDKKTCGEMLVRVVFGGYCLLVLVGYVFVCLRILNISIFILGELIVALLLMTSGAFFKLFKDLIKSLRAKNFNGNWTLRWLVKIGIALYIIVGLIFSACSLFFFVYLECTDKSIDPNLSRELNSGCVLDEFWDAHDLWHFFASHSLMMVILVVIQMEKPCRDCYQKYKKCRAEAEAAEEAEELEEATAGNTPAATRYDNQAPEVIKTISLIDED